MAEVMGYSFWNYVIKTLVLLSLSTSLLPSLGSLVLEWASCPSASWCKQSYETHMVCWGIEALRSMAHEKVQPANNHMSEFKRDLSASVESWDDYRPGQWPNYNLMRNLNQNHSAKSSSNSWPTELWANKCLLLF